MAVIPVPFNLVKCRLSEGNAYVRLQHAVFHVLEADNGGPARVVDFTIFGLVLISAVNLAIGNHTLEFFFISVFAAEYLIRLWCMVWHRDYRQGGWKGRLKYATTNAAAVIDFIAIWPTLVVMIVFGEVEILPIFRLISRLIMTGRRFSRHALDGTGNAPLGDSIGKRPGYPGGVLVGCRLPDARRRNQLARWKP